MGEASSHGQHSQDAPARLQPLVLCGHARDFQCFLHEMLLHPLSELAAQGVAIGMNLSFLRKAACQAGFFPPILGGSGQQPCTLPLC